MMRVSPCVTKLECDVVTLVTGHAANERVRYRYATMESDDGDCYEQRKHFRQSARKRIDSLWLVESPRYVCN